ncbi:class I SAM-dependent methyltransferase [Sphingomonas xinjiangensis]|uniref:SAM-dependent methyltransferase n=1 Tax=Sphingomonas xinjiangensis TaxID=643568 RepID=A0A840YJQ2_9SPHN|nr:class I SAM-dependent methyltransferase [Sphingomonas xinjiangensis]MBB5709166.1 SAM-dependent methyltransferase [Sphingomonas xinjiangensis]
MTKAFDWTGRVGDVWAAEWQRTDRSLAGVGAALNAAILAAAPERGSAIDIGCGAGSTSLALAAIRPALSINGIDLSPALVGVARERGAGVANLQFDIADAQSLGGRRADLLFSRHGVMFFADPVAGFAALREAAAPGAALVFSCFRPRADNAWTRVVDAAVGNDPAPVTGYAPGPYGLADPDFTRDVLRRAGWTRAAPHSVDFRYVAGAGADPVDDALSFLSRIGSAARTLADAAPERRAALCASLRNALTQHVRDGAVAFDAGAWIWTATAGEPA